jgi:NAD(P)H-dependent flavin oxidoreductase YrpB (nitropropane dioxygenase family)
MAGGVTTMELVAAVCRTGALGFLGPRDYTFLRKNRYQ